VSWRVVIDKEDGCEDQVRSDVRFVPRSTRSQAGLKIAPGRRTCGRRAGGVGYRDKGGKASEAEVARALTGSYREEHLFELKPAYEAWQFSLGPVGKVDAQVALQLGRMRSDRALPPLEPKARPKRRVNSPGFDVRTALYHVVGLDLTEIEGVSALTALTLIGGIDPAGLSRFASVKKFCSWLGLCPNGKKTGGRVRSRRTRRG
jgi:hypothetical protein